MQDNRKIKVSIAEAVSGMLLNGLGVVVPGQEAGSAAVLGRQPSMAVENEFNGVPYTTVMEKQIQKIS